MMLSKELSCAGEVDDSDNDDDDDGADDCTGERGAVSREGMEGCDAVGIGKTGPLFLETSARTLKPLVVVVTVLTPPLGLSAVAFVSAVVIAEDADDGEVDDDEEEVVYAPIAGVVVVEDDVFEAVHACDDGVAHICSKILALIFAF
jgi:hypothetical protein